MECYVNLREEGTAINIHLTETWWRHYQVSLHNYGFRNAKQTRSITTPPWMGCLSIAGSPLTFSQVPLTYIHLHSRSGKGTVSSLRTDSLSIPHPHSPLGHFTLRQFLVHPSGHGQTLLAGACSQATL